MGPKTRTTLRNAVLALSIVLHGCDPAAGPAPVPGQPQPSAPLLPAPQPSASPTPAANQAPQLEVRATPTPIRGLAPLDLRVNLCRSQDPDGDPLAYVFEYAGEGKRFSNECQASHTYERPIRTRAVFCVSDGEPRHLVCRTFEVMVS